ncbi:MAG: 30S ribosomal protein S7 [Alphaproteobacteria bacterium]|nr:30S ribosomal protein S7 [Alphaproteobacteria bacterium]
MSRRHRAEKRAVTPDVKFGSEELARFINKVMSRGKRSIAEKIVYGAFTKIESKHKTNAFDIFSEAIKNVKPALEVSSVRVGGANYQVPSVVEPDRSFALAARWIIKAASSRSELTMQDKLAGEFYDAANSKGGSVKKKEDTHKMAEANKAFAHLSPKKMKN